MFSHLPRQTTPAEPAESESANLPPWLASLHQDIGPVGAMWLFRQQASIDEFYIRQKDAVVRALAEAETVMARALRDGGVQQLILPPLRASNGRGHGKLVFAPLGVEGRATLARHLGYVTTWKEDAMYIIARASQLRGASKRPMIPEPVARAGEDVAMATKAPRDPGDVGHIKKYLKVYREERSICQLVCEAYLGSNAEPLGDDMSLLVFFGGLDLPQLFALRDAGKLTSTLIRKHLYSDDPMSTMHCGMRLSSAHVGPKAHASLYPATTAKAVAQAEAKGRAAAARSTKYRLKDRTRGTTFQKNLIKRRHSALDRKQQNMPPVEESDVRTMRVVDGRQASVCARCGEVDSFIEEYSSRTIICKGCGNAETSGAMQTVSLDYERIERTRRPTAYAYDPANHFRAWLDRVQAKQSAFIPPEVVEAVEAECAKHNKRVDELCVRLVRKFLQNRGMSHHYSNEYKILYLVARIKPPVILPEREVVLGKMFQDYKHVWHRVKPKNRKNRLSYSFLLNRFCKLQNWDEYRDIFRLPISEDNQNNQEHIWGLVCKDLKWA